MKNGHKTANVALAEKPADEAAAKDEVGAFLAALAGLLHDTIGRLEDTVGDVTGRVVSRPTLADRDLVVALQSFDRLQQEFAALGGVLAQYAAKRVHPASDSGREALLRELVGTISVHDLKQRLIDKMVGAELLQPEESAADNDAVF